jgi:hypothetical protein
MTTPKQRLESKVRKLSKEIVKQSYDVPEDQMCEWESEVDDVQVGANLLAPLLLEMVEALKIANTGYNEVSILKVETALNKFEEFLK